MKADSYRFDGSGKCRLDKLATNSKADGIDKEKILAMTAENLQKMAALQDAFYADGREGLIFVLQAMDAAGKDSTIKHMMSGLNPQGVQVTSFKQPNSEELKHDFLWRVNKALPARGSIAIFNRSYYEDVLVVQLHDLQKGYQMAPRVLEQDKDEFFAQRYRQIRHYEQYLYENSYRVVKIFLHVSKNEQITPLKTGSSPPATWPSAPISTIINACTSRLSMPPPLRRPRGTPCPPTRNGTRGIS